MHRHARDPEARERSSRWLYPRLVAEHAYLNGRRTPAGTSAARDDASVGVRPRQLAGLGPRPRRDGHPARLDPALRAPRPRPRQSGRPADERGLRPVRLPGRALPQTRLRRRAAPRRRAVPRRRAAVQRDPPLVDPRAGRDRGDRRRGPGAASRGRASGSTPRCSTSCGTRRRAGSAPSTSSAASASVEDTIVSFAPLLDPDLPTAQLDAIMTDLRSASFHPDRPDGYVVPDLRPRGRGVRRTALLARARLDQHELAAVDGPPPARPGRGGRRDPPEQPRPRRAQSGFREYFDPFGGEGFGTDGFGWTAALTLDFIERVPAADRARVGEAIGHGP